ncbi:MAG: L,D-transpeptidase family protein [Candidatus Komeilibacteria bacterium]|nr:L,D-transpeptidase family protein [Candidatus Komeilibacteria bacterium]
MGVFSLAPGLVWAQATSTESAKVDSDQDGLTDVEELQIFKTDPTLSDTDGDGYTDGDEVAHNYDPLSESEIKLIKKITISLKEQKLTYYLGPYQLGTFPISSGTAKNPTPTGSFKIDKKGQKVWSKAAGLWMPWWLSFKGGVYAIHELPIWPNGKREGSNHLGKPVSHGCVRLGVGPAKLLYDWASLGTPVVITKN